MANGTFGAYGLDALVTAPPPLLFEQRMNKTCANVANAKAAKRAQYLAAAGCIMKNTGVPYDA